MKKQFELQKDVNFFGRMIPKGTIYTELGNRDLYQPQFNGSKHPNLELSFMVVLANEEYFKQI